MPIDRRQLLGAAGSLAVTTTLSSRVAFAAARTVKIGLVAPRTGAAAVFNDSMDFALERLKATVKSIKINGIDHPYEIVVKDGQTNPNRAAEVAMELIQRNKIDLMLAFGTPMTVIPVADVCELNGVPCLTNDAPLEAYFFGRKGDPKKGFNWTYHFFFMADRITQQYIAGWNRADTNKQVGALWPNDDDGQAFARTSPKIITDAGYKLTDPGRFDVGSASFNPQIAAFKAANVEIVTGLMIPPDFIQFWNGCAQQGFKPKIVNVGRAYEIPGPLMAIGERAYGLRSIIWWSPYHPYKSGLTGETSKEFADAYEAATGKTWNVGLGFRHALLETAFDVLSRATDIDKPESIRDALKATNYQSMVGLINFSRGPFPNVSETPIALGQYAKGDKAPLKQDIIDNSLFPEIPVTAEPMILK